MYTYFKKIKNLQLFLIRWYTMFHMKRFTSKTQKIGQIGEKIAEMFLMKHGFSIIDRNFTHKLGEIDIIAQKNDRLFFFEVKTIVNKQIQNNNILNNSQETVSHETYIKNNISETISKKRQKIPKNYRETSVKHIETQINLQIKNINDDKNVPVDDTCTLSKNTGVHNLTQNPVKKTLACLVSESELPVANNKISHPKKTYNPFENMSYNKMRKFSKVVEIYLSQKNVSRETRWQIDGLGVVLSKNSETGNITGQVERLENIIIR